MMGDIYEKCARVAQINGIIAELTDKYDPGVYRFARRYPQEYVEYFQIAAEFLRSNIAEVELIGQRMGELVFAIDETDTVFKAHRCDSLQAQVQIELLKTASINMGIACFGLINDLVKRGAA